MIDRWRAEIELVRRRCGELEVAPDMSWVIIKSFPIPGGWTRTTSELLFVIPSGYPVTPPDNFYVANDLFLEGGGEPGNAPRDQVQLGRSWRMFSWHLDDTWRPHADVTSGDNLLTFLLKCEDRLTERS